MRKLQKWPKLWKFRKLRTNCESCESQFVIFVRIAIRNFGIVAIFAIDFTTLVSTVKFIFNNRVISWSKNAVPDVSSMCISRIKFGQLYIVAYLKIFFISLSLIITGPMALTTMIGIQQEMLYQELWLGNYRLLWSLGTFKMFQKRSKVFYTRTVHFTK